MEQIRKTFKADTNVGEEGKFRAVVSTFGTVDSQGESIEKGAFSGSISDEVPVLWDHQWDNIWSHIGSAKATETEEGLVVDATLDLDNPTAEQAFKLLKSGRVKEFSIGGYEPSSSITVSDDGVRHIGKFNLVEVSLTLRGSNPKTRLINVKADDQATDQGGAGANSDTGSSDEAEDSTQALVDAITSVSDALAGIKDDLDIMAGNDSDSQDETDGQDPSSDGADSSASGSASGKSRSARIAAAKIALAAAAGKEF